MVPGLFARRAWFQATLYLWEDEKRSNRESRKIREAADNAASSREDTEKIIFKYRKRRVKQQDLQAESAIVPDSDVSEEKS